MKEHNVLWDAMLMSLVAVCLILASPNTGRACSSSGTGNWGDTSLWTSCSGSMGLPGSSDAVGISWGTVSTTMYITVNMISITSPGIFNAGSQTITLSNTSPFSSSSTGTFNAGTSTVRLSDADHTLWPDYTFYNLITVTPTASRTITVNGNITVKNNFIDGTAAFPIKFVGTGSVSQQTVRWHLTVA